MIELELCNSSLDPIITPGKLIKSGDAAVYTTANTGSNWSIENICVKVDCCTLDNSLNNEYTAHLLAGKALPIKYSTLISQQSSISGSIASVQVSRAVSRLQKAFITLYKTSIIHIYSTYLFKHNIYQSRKLSSLYIPT